MCVLAELHQVLWADPPIIGNRQTATSSANLLSPSSCQGKVQFQDSSELLFMVQHSPDSIGLLRNVFYCNEEAICSGSLINCLLLPRSSTALGHECRNEMEIQPHSLILAKFTFICFFFFPLSESTVSSKQKLKGTSFTHFLCAQPHAIIGTQSYGQPHVLKMYHQLHGLFQIFISCNL